MKTVLLLVSAVITSTSFADSNQPAHEMFDMTNLITTRTLVDIVVVNDVDAECDRQAAKRFGREFVNRSMACSFWNDSTCTIIVSQHTSYTLLGHEIRHCFQGHFH